MMEGVGTLCCYSFRLLIKHQWNVKAISSCKACLTFMWSCSLSQRATPDPPSVLHILLNVTLPRSWNSLWLWGFFSCKPKRMWLRFFPLGIFIKVCTFFPPLWYHGISNSHALWAWCPLTCVSYVSEIYMKRKREVKWVSPHFPAIAVML